MKKSRLVWCLYASLSLIILLLSVCEVRRNNPLDESGSSFVSPQIIIDTTGAGVSNGDTIHFDSATVIVSGNRSESRFAASIDSGTGSSWQSSGKFHFDSLGDGKHAIVVGSKYDGGSVFVYDTIVFHVLTTGYKPAYTTHLDSIVQTDTGVTLAIVAIAAGMTPIAYQWEKGDAVIAGGGRDTLIISDVQSRDSGSYRCVASNEWGADTCRSYKVKIVIPPPPTYTVTYGDNHSTGGSVPVDGNAYEKGATVTVKANVGNLTRTGYVFAGWNTSADGSGTSLAAGVDFAMGSGNMMLYAKWTQNPTYTITYNGNGNTSGSVPADANAYEQGAIVTVKGNTGSLVNSGYSFVGWNTSADGKGTSYAAGIDFNMGQSNIILYAKWTQNPTYTVTYNGNGNTSGTAPTDANAYLQGSSVAVLGNTGNLARTGYTFIGWSSTADTTGTSYATGTTFSLGSGNAILYAKWTQNPTYTVVYNGNGATGGIVPTDANVYLQGATVTVKGNPGNLARSGYSLVGWTVAADGGGTAYTSGATFTMASGNVVLYAKWAISTFSVTFNSNGGSAVAGQTVAYDSTATQPAAPSRTGYGFSGWYSDSLLTNAFTFPTPITAATTLYAKWTINTYTVTFNSNGGSAVASQTVAYSSTATLPTPAPSKTGYGLVGWYADSLLTNAFSFSAPITAAITLYAKWTINTYTVTFNSNGGSTVANQTVAYNSTATVPAPAPTRTGYGFSGWYSDSLLANTYSFSAPITASTTLYARWTANTYTVTFNSNGGSTVVNQTVAYNSAATLPAPAPTKTGYGFSAWYSDSLLTNAYSFSTPITAATMLYAKWTINTYTVTFSSNGGSIVASQSVAYNSAATLPAPAPTRTGYGFSAWYSDSLFANAYSFSTPITAATTLYAKWTINTYTVTFSSNGGSIVASQSVAYNSAATLPAPAPTRTGYGFSAWYSDSLFANAYSFSTPITAATTLYAKWTINTYTVTFNSNGGSIVASQAVAYNSAATLPAPAPTKTGYGFSAWYSDSLLTNAFSFSTPITAATTVYAKWTISTYTVTFNSNGGNAIPNQTVAYNSTATQPTAPTKTGYGFSAWYSDSLLTNAFSFSTPITAAITLYAKWTINTYTITFSSNGGSAVANQTVAYDSTATLPTPAPTNAGCSLAGWYSDPTLTVSFSFSTPITASITIYAKWVAYDFDGNVYQTVKIGTQLWMVENLKTSKYNDGTSIPLVTDSAAWKAMTTPGYCWNNDSATIYKATYGALYNWYVVNTGKLAPAGWHVPKDSEWTVLTTYLGGLAVAGGPLKEAGTAHWVSPNTGATNSSGFSALPGNLRYWSGDFGPGGTGTEGYWWSSTAFDAANSWSRSLFNTMASVNRGSQILNTNGVSVRCVRDP